MAEARPEGAKENKPGLREAREERRAAAEERKAEAKAPREQERLVRDLEMQILTLEGRQKELAAELEKPETYNAGGAAMQLNRELLAVTEDLARVIRSGRARARQETALERRIWQPITSSVRKSHGESRKAQRK